MDIAMEYALEHLSPSPFKVKLQQAEREERRLQLQKPGAFSAIAQDEVTSASRFNSCVNEAVSSVVQGYGNKCILRLHVP